MATKKDTKADSVEAFVLLDCIYGKCGEVVTLPAAEADNGKQCGMLDLNPAAVKAAKAEE